MQRLLQFFKSFYFLKGLLISSAAFIALLVSYYFFELEIGIGMAFGVLIVSMSDITGLRRQRIGGMFTALLVGVFNYTMVQLSMFSFWVLYPVTAICVFLSSYISIYGFRASLVSFASLLGIAVSFARPVTMDQVDNFAFYIILGGLWYMVLALLTDRFTPPILRNELLSTTMEQSAALLRENINLIKEPRQKSGRKAMNKLQVSLTELHEQLRDELLSKEIIQGIGGSQRKQLMITAELIDLFEVVVSQRPGHELSSPAEDSYRHAINCICKYLENSAKRLEWLLKDEEKGRKRPDESRQLDHKCLAAIDHYRSDVVISEHTEAILHLRNLHDYARDIDEKTGCVERFVRESDERISSNEITERQKFLTRQTYEPLLIKEHLSLQSPIFRHSIRVVLAIMMGMLIGHFFEIPQTYWILLTIFVIMRPAYALTKLRSKQRTTGTLIGAALAGGLVFLFREQAYLIILTFITLTLAFTYVQHNYKTSATFVTIAIILIYVLLTSNAFEVIQFRILDTLIGAGISLLTNYLILPYWEYNRINDIILTYIRAEHHYLNMIDEMYREKKRTNTPYRLARKEVFLMMSQLDAAFQRHLQEPRSQQRKGSNKLQVLISTAQSLLSATAAMGTYIQIHQTTEASVHYDTYIRAIRNQLKKAVKLIDNEDAQEFEDTQESVEEARDALVVYYYVLKDKLKRMEARGETDFTPGFRESIKEAKLISEQLEWIYKLSYRFVIDLEDFLQVTGRSGDLAGDQRSNL